MTKTLQQHFTKTTLNWWT